jgi:penicillin amidase
MSEARVPPQPDDEAVRRVRRGGAVILIAAAIAAAVCFGTSPALRLAPGPAAGAVLAASGTNSQGPGAPVRIVTDRYGIPHVRAANLPDLYFGWGYVTARDRLWQLEYTRRAARGGLWKWLGNSTLQADGGAQLFRFGERADSIWERERANPEVAIPVSRYADGINAYLGECRAGRAPWPREFGRLGYRPAGWKPEDSVLLLLGLGITLDLDLPELAEGREIAAHGREWVEARERFEGDWIYDTIPDSAAKRLYGTPAIRKPKGASAPGRSRRGALAPELLRRAERALAALRDPANVSTDDDDRRASNEFAVGPKRSASGAPLLANDPHLHLTSPGPFHVIHISVPGVVEAIGASVPGLPSIVSGRNLRCAWGVTALSADVVDVYADTLSADGRRVRMHDSAGAFTGWAPVREAPFDLGYTVLGLQLPIPGQVRRYTPHGPVVVFDRKQRIALSVRWAVDDARITMGGLVGLERSHSAAEVAARYRALSTPCINALAADEDGHVIYQATGNVPRRASDPGRGPLPGDGRHEWQGLIAPERMPAWEAPRGGFVVNANNRPVGVDYPEALPRYDWIHDRAQRIAQRLAGDRSVTLQDMVSVQNDVYSRAGARGVPLLLACADSVPELLTPRVRAALDTLRGWDFYARRSRVAPTLFRSWMSALQRRSRTEGRPGLTIAALDGRAPEALRTPGSEQPERAAIAAVRGLESALDELEKRLGANPAGWTWARAHRARFEHPLSALDGRAKWEPGPIAEDGDGSSPAVAGSGLPWSTDVTHGPAFRHVVDLAVTDSSLGIVPPFNAARESGATGARDLATRWANHAYVPLYLSWELIERAKESEIALTPR